MQSVFLGKPFAWYESQTLFSGKNKKNILKMSFASLLNI